MEKQKLYKKNEDGGMEFISYRKGEVRIPNYVYDLWLPIIGATGIALYSTYCRLEREGSVKAMTQRKLAAALRIGWNTLKSTNEMLEDCGFIKIFIPQGHERMMHWTTRVEIHEVPTKVSQEIIKKYAVEDKYEPLSTWLVKSEEDEPKHQVVLPQDTSECHDEAPEDNSNIESLDVESLDVESLDLKHSSASPSLDWDELAKDSEQKTKQHLERLREEHPDIALGIPLKPNLEGVLDGINDYPPDVQNIIKEFSKRWRVLPPSKNTSLYGKWIKDAREIKEHLITSGLTAEVVMAEAYYEWKKPPDYSKKGRAEYDGKFTVTDIGSLNKFIWERCSAILDGRSTRKTKTYTDQNGNKKVVDID